MKRIFCHAVVWFLALGVGGQALAQGTAAPPAALGENAALRYWPGFHFLPKFDDKQQAVLDSWHADKVDTTAATALLTQGRRTLRYFHQGAAIQRCDWGLNFDEGFELLLPYLSMARDTARLAMLDARVRFDAGDTRGAVENLADAFCLARHAGAHDILVSIMVQYACEAMVADFVKPRIDKFNSADRAYLLTRLETLPAGGSIERSVRVERETGLNWIIRAVEKAKDRPDWAEDTIKPFVNMSGKPVFDSKNPQELIDQLKAMRPMYDEAEAALQLSPEAARAKLAELKNRTVEFTACRAFFPDYSRVYDKHSESEARMAQLKALLHGPAGEKNGGK